MNSLGHRSVTEEIIRLRAAAVELESRGFGFPASDIDHLADALDKLCFLVAAADPLVSAAMASAYERARMPDRLAEVARQWLAEDHGSGYCPCCGADESPDRD